MTTYYERGGIVIYHGSCLSFLDWLSADVMVTDPPYGMNYGNNILNAAWPAGSLAMG